VEWRGKEEKGEEEMCGYVSEGEVSSRVECRVVGIRDKLRVDYCTADYTRV
jgi:hypothetical protein